MIVSQVRNYIEADELDISGEYTPRRCQNLAANPIVGPSLGLARLS